MNEPMAYLNGDWLPAARAALSVADAGVVQGATVSEFTRTFRHRPWRLEEHLARLARGLAAVGFEPEESPARLAELARELVAHNARLIHPDDDLGVIHFVTAGLYPTYAAAAGRPGPTVCIHTFRLPFHLWAARLRDGARLVTPSARALPPACLDPTLKVRSRLHWYLADREARRADPAAVALLLDLDGHVTETATANFLAVRSGALLSPRADRILPGTSRAAVLDLAAALGLPCNETDLTRADAEAADEAVLTSTPFGLMPVASVNGRPPAGGRPGPLTRRLRQAYDELVGLDVAAQIEAGARRG